MQEQNPNTIAIEVFVVDNSIDVKDSDDINTYCEALNWVNLLKPEKNLGYFGGLNYALSKIDVSKFDFICIGNNDLEFNKSFLSVLSKKHYPKEYFAICPDIKSITGKYQNPHVEKPYSTMQKIKLDLYYSSWRIALFLMLLQNTYKKFKKPVNNRKSKRVIHMGIGAFYILTPYFFSKNEELIFPYFLYGEEAFLSHQIHESGGELFYDPDLKILHNESAALSKIPSLTKYQYSRQSYKTHREYL